MSGGHGGLILTYFPLDRDILTSSLWAQGTPKAMKVWLYLLLVADPRTGMVEDSDPGIALRCGLTLEETEEVLEWLAAPDRKSRTLAEEGRRIRRIPGTGIEIINYTRKRDKDYSTPRVKRWRERNGETVDETVKRSLSDTETTNKNKNKNTNKRKQRTTEAADAAVKPEPSKVDDPNWNTQFADDFRTTYGVTKVPGMFFPQVERVATVYGWRVTRPALLGYMRETEVALLAIPKVLGVRIEQAQNGHHPPPRAGPRASPEKPRLTQGEAHELVARREELATEFVAWFKANGNGELMGMAFSRWRGLKGMAGSGLEVLVLREAERQIREAGDGVHVAGTSGVAAGDRARESDRGG